jgi:hypothetical protein
MNDQTKAAFASAADTAKQLITLATGLLGLEIAFLKGLVKQPSSLDALILKTSWVLLAVSIAMGLAALMALTGSLAQQFEPNQRSIYKSNVKRPMTAQIVSFFASIVLSVVFAFRSI